ncbi:MAG: CfrBI family restriction endonuclease [Bacteroidetes bacterium]|nr:CfrBI family restriction endonuclease [Bacteroidota bacterium]
MTIGREIIQSGVASLLKGHDHRKLVYRLVSTSFIEVAISFFKKVVEVKLGNDSIDLSWYREAFIEYEYAKESIAANAGLSVKSISNSRGTTRKEIVLDEALSNFDELVSIINSLCDSHSEVELQLSITFNSVTVQLSLNESLLVINALGMKRKQIAGGIWSSFGKQAEKPLLEVMCRIFQVPEEHYNSANRTGLREVDFSLIDSNGHAKKCEVKLQGRGNPEGADSTFARDSDVFIAGTLSETNIIQLNEEGIHWVELMNPHGFLRFGKVLADLNIPHQPVDSECNIDEIIDRTVLSI